MTAKDKQSHVIFMAENWRKLGGTMPMTRKAKSVMLVSSKSGQWDEIAFENRKGFSEAVFICRQT
jgi:hypothetical protein